MGILDATRKSLAKSIYMPDAELTVYAAAIVASHAVDLFQNVPRILLSSDKGGYGKTQALRCAEYMTPNPFYSEGTNTTSYALKARLHRPERATLIVDEASKVFGASGRAGKSNPLNTILTSGYDRASTIRFSEGGSDNESSAYCFAFLGGLATALPGDVLTRTIRIDMVKRPKHVVLTPAPSRREELTWLARPIAGWVGRNGSLISDAYSRLPTFHAALCDRPGEVWGPLVAVAAADGPTELERMLAAFSAIGLDIPTDTRTMDERVLEAALALADAASEDVVFSGDLIRELSAWTEWAGFTPRETAMRLASMLGGAKDVWSRDRSAHRRGWTREHLSSLLALFTPSVPVAFVRDEFDDMLD